jgi:hypothetical protein
VILDHQQAKSGMPTTGGVNTRNNLKKLSSASRGSSEEDHQPLNETVDNSVGGASGKSSKQLQSPKDEPAAAEGRLNSARSSKKRKIEEISNEDANASSPSQSRKKMLRGSPAKEEDLNAKEEFVSLPSVYLKPLSSQDACAAPEDALNLDSLKSALPEESATVIVVASSSSDD